MTSFLVRRSFGVFIGAALLVNVNWGADTARPASAKSTTGSSAQRSAASRSGSAKGPLPDPALLDGGSQAAEKKSEYGMIGDFEMPGDENAKEGKVGGQQNQNPGSSGGQGNNQQTGLPQGGGGGGGQESQQQGGAQGGRQAQQGGGQQQQGGAQGGGQAQQGGEQIQPGGGQTAGGGQAGGGPENPNAGGNPVGGGGESGAQPQGMQVAELGGGASGQQGSAGEAGQGGKPTAVAIGDKAMRIEPTANAPGVIGVQPQQKIADGHVQQHDKGTGTGGKAPTSPQGPGRIEKGRAIPVGL